MWRNYFTSSLLIVLLLGLISGLPLALTASTLGRWLAETHVDKSTIGLFAIITTSYTLKFLWSPIIDTLSLPVLSARLGRRRSWMLAAQLLTVVSVLLLALARPDINPLATALAALLVAFASASQDIVIDAYRVELLSPEEQGRGAAMIQLGYRLGMLISGAGALYLATYTNWQMTYMLMAALLAIGCIVTFLAPEPVSHDNLLPPERESFVMWIQRAVISPFKDFMSHPSWWMILLFIVIYKLADSFSGRMLDPFYYEMGFSKITIANIVKIYGTTATLVGIFVGGALTARYGTLRILFVSGVMHAASNAMYVWQAYAGDDTVILALGVVMENITGGIGSAAFVAFLGGLCNVHYTATQYALLSSMSAIGRTWISASSGVIANALGWKMFFTFSGLLALPGLLLLVLLTKQLKDFKGLQTTPHH